MKEGFYFVFIAHQQMRRESLKIAPDTAVIPLHPSLNFIEVTATYLFL